MKRKVSQACERQTLPANHAGIKTGGKASRNPQIQVGQVRTKVGAEYAADFLMCEDLQPK